CPGALQSGCGCLAFLCLFCGGKNISRYHAGRSEVRHGPLGRGNLLLPSVVGTADYAPRLATRTIGNRESGGPSPREQGFIDAAALFYKDAPRVPHSTRALAYQKAMAAVAARNPDDREAQIFYALALL